MCITQGVPDVPFFVDRDLTRADGIIRCRQVTALELLQLGWKELRALSIVLKGIPIPP